MPIVITPQGEYIDSVTGNPVGIPPQRPDIPSSGSAMSEQEMRMMTGAAMTPQEMARENIPPNMDMGMDSMMPQVDEKTLVEIDFLMKEFNLSMDEAIEAVARTRDTGVRPEEFSGQQQAPMQPQMPMARPTMPSSRIGALPSAPPPRPDMSGLSREQMDLLRRGIDPFAEGMVR